MELTLTRQTDTHIAVTCNSQPSHTFDLHTLLPNNDNGLPQPLDDPVTYGKAIYSALFPPDTPAQHALASAPQRILLITTDKDLDAIPWEYAHGPDGFLVLEYPFVRGLPTDQRIDPPVLNSGLHIVAVPSNPISHKLHPLNIDGEWTRLKETIDELPYTVTLERTRPPTLERVRHLVANQRNRIVHFMGHGGQDEKEGAILCFEQDNGDLETVTAKDFLRRVRGTVFLVTLNACVSATPGATPFSNLAAALMRQKTPYTLGMRFSIQDDDARAFSRVFYSELARGVAVEEALYQARLRLAKSKRSWVIGVPVLYTSLSAPAAGFTCLPGTPTIKEHQPRREVTALPRAEGIFQGRIDELQQLGTALTGDNRPPIITIHGGGGQGKTALAREAIERFAHAWPGGVWATTLENLPSRELFVNDLARFLDIDTQKVLDPKEIERLVVAQLSLRRTLIVLDNAETLVEAVEANNEEVVRLAQFIRDQLPRPPVSLLATSRSFLGWADEVGCELTGLAPIDGVKLFEQHAPQRRKEANRALVWDLSEKVEGHPLSLRLLSSAFNASPILLPAFVREYEEQLLNAENKYTGVDHRHRKLYASIETSVRYLSDDLRTLLSGLWLFHARFLAETATTIFDPQHENTEANPSPIRDCLHTLWQRGLLTRETITVRDGKLQFYHLLPTTRPYIEQHLQQAYERKALLQRFGAVCFQVARVLYRGIDRSGVAVVTAQQAREDMERGGEYVAGIEQGYYLLRWGWVVQRLGNPRHGLELTERALAIAQGQDRSLEFYALNNMAKVYQDTGQPQQALRLLEQALPITREVGNCAGEATTLHNMALVYQLTGQPQQALALYEQAFPITPEVGDRAGEATTLNNMGLLYQATGQPQQALALYEQALPIMREVGDRAGEATTLNNMAEVYRGMRQPQQVLWLLEQALPIMREVGDRAGEATTLHNMAEMYRVMRQPQQALSLYQQVLPIRREVDDRAGEATTLNGLAYLFRDMWRYTEALAAFEQSIALERQVSHRSGEAAGLVGIALLLYQHLNRAEEAITHLEQAIAVLVEMGLTQDAAGQTIENLRHALQIMRSGDSLMAQTSGPATMPAEQIQQIISNTLVVMTTVPDSRAEWREAITEALQHAQQQGAAWQSEVEFFTAVLDILAGQSPNLASDHPYAQAIAVIQKGTSS